MMAVDAEERMSPCDKHRDKVGLRSFMPAHVGDRHSGIHSRRFDREQRSKWILFILAKTQVQQVNKRNKKQNGYTLPLSNSDRRHRRRVEKKHGRNTASGRTLQAALQLKEKGREEERGNLWTWSHQVSIRGSVIAEQTC